MATQNVVAVGFPPLLAIKHFVTGHFLGDRDDHVLKTNIIAYHPSHNPSNLESQFVAEKAITEPGSSDGCFHLRCRSNNRYLRRSLGPFLGNVVSAIGDVGGEVYNTPECTLFRPFRDPVSGKTTAIFMGNGFILGETTVYGPTEQILRWSIRDNDEASTWNFVTEFEVVHLSVPKLPRLVSFKADNGMFLQASKHPNDGLVYNVFDGTDLAQPTLLYEVSDISATNIIPYPVSVKSYFYDKFLKRAHDNWVLSDTPEGSEIANPNTIFRVDHSARDDNSVHLINLGNNKYCTREGAGNRLYAGADDTAPAGVHLEVVEPVVSRTILVRPDDFRLGDAVTSEHQTIDMDHQIASNPENVEKIVTMMLKYERTRSGFWDNLETIKWGGKAEFTSPIPQIVSESRVAIEGAHQEPYPWGQTVTQQITPSIFHQVVVPPRTEVHVTLVAKKATCQVPFSYRQTDVLAFGPRRVYNKDDGRYTGTHVYDYQVVQDPKPIMP